MGGDGIVPSRLALIEHAAADVGVAGIVDENVDRPKLSLHFGKGRSKRVALRHIDSNGRGPRPRCLKLVDDCLIALCIA
jgi:hypothetical protein